MSVSSECFPEHKILSLARYAAKLFIVGLLDHHGNP